MKKYENKKEKIELKESIRDEDAAGIFFIQEMMKSLKNTANDKQMAQELGYEIGYRIQKSFAKHQPQYLNDFTRGVIKGIK